MRVAQILRLFLALICLALSDRDIRPGSGQRPHDALTNTLPTPGDERRAPFQ